MLNLRRSKSCQCRVLGLLVVLALGACTMVPDSVLKRERLAAENAVEAADLGLPIFELEGRLGVRVRAENYLLNLFWRHGQQGDAVRLSGPLGQTVGTLLRLSEQLTLTTTLGQFVASDADALMQHLWGWSMPLSNLSVWVLGRAVAAEIDAATYAADGRLLTLSQQGWKLAFLRYQQQEGQLLPVLLTLTHQEVALRLKIDCWRRFNDTGTVIRSAC